MRFASLATPRQQGDILSFAREGMGGRGVRDERSGCPSQIVAQDPSEPDRCILSGL